jgi:hypothetical protein
VMQLTAFFLHKPCLKWRGNPAQDNNKRVLTNEAVLYNFTIMSCRTCVLLSGRCLTEILHELFFESTCLFQSPHLQLLRQYTESEEESS